MMSFVGNLTEHIPLLRKLKEESEDLASISTRKFLHAMFVAVALCAFVFLFRAETWVWVFAQILIAIVLLVWTINIFVGGDRKTITAYLENKAELDQIKQNKQDNNDYRLRASAYRKVGIQKMAQLRFQISNLQRDNQSSLSQISEYQEKTSLFEAQIDKLTQEKQAVEKQLTTAEELVKKLQNEKRSTGQINTKKIKSLEDAISVQKDLLSKENASHEATKKDIFSSISPSEVFQEFHKRSKAGQFQGIAKEDMALLYSALDQKFPDMARVKELAHVPLELQRAQQIETINEYYSELITKTEKDDNISPQEKKEKINGYRTARGKEMKLMHGEG